jgi:stearoyl-CoA desaturase (Delta-9 desaturase)
MPVIDLEQASAPPKFQIRWYGAAPLFLAMHLIALAGIVFIRPTWVDLVLCASLYFVRMFAITAGYHRLFSHRSYKATRGFQFFIALLGTLSNQKGVLWWASHHRDHHRYSDTEDDPHSPVLRGFWYSHVGWFLCGIHDETDYSKISDFAKYPELVWLNKHHIVPSVIFATLLYLVGGIHFLMWGFFISTVFLYHATFTINSLSHIYGVQRYDTGDFSRNNWILALLTLGEGWHNNHHYYMSSVRQGFYWWEIDVSYYLIRFFSFFGLTSELRRPPASVLDDGYR